MDHQARARKTRRHAEDGRNSRLFAKNARQLWLIALTIAASLVLFYGLGAVIIELVVMKRNPNLNKEKKFQELDVTYEDISEEVIPYVQRWFRTLYIGSAAAGIDDKHLIPTVFEKAAHDDDDDADLSCLEAWFSDMMEHLDGFTSPPYMEMVLENMGLRHSVLIRKILHDHLQAPQTLFPLYNTSLSCLGNMNGVAELACELRKDGALWDLGGNMSHRNYATYAVNMAVTIEILTRELQSNLPALHEVIDVMNNEGYRKYQDHVYRNYPDRASREFLLQKYEGMALYLKWLGQEMATGKAFPGVAPLSLQINILEAVKLDAIVGHDLNARVGLALATKVQYDKNDNLDWGLGKEWIDAYMTWNMVFVMGQLPLRTLGKLFIPSVVCEADSMAHGKDWWIPRVLSLALTLIVRPGEPVDEGVGLLPEGVVQDILETESVLRGTSAWRWPIARRLGQINFATAEITPPSTNSVEQTLFKLCGGVCHGPPFDASDTIPQEEMDDKQFLVYAGFIIWITVLLAGLGCEVFVWYHFLQVWDDSREGLWRFSQFLFPLLGTTALGFAHGRDFWAIPFFVVAFWKFGFPETLMYLYLGLFSSASSRQQRIADLINGLGTVAHHSASALTLGMLLSGVFPLDRSIAGPCFVLVMQHWIALLVYVKFWLYTGLVLFLEFWFEWFVISEFSNIYYLHWTAALSAAVMLFAHWLYLLGGGLGLLIPIVDQGSTQTGHDNVHTRGGKEASQRRLSVRHRLSINQQVKRNSAVSWQLGAAFYEEQSAILREDEDTEENGARPNLFTSEHLETQHQEMLPRRWRTMLEGPVSESSAPLELHERKKGDKKSEPAECEVAA